MDHSAAVDRQRWLLLFRVLALVAVVAMIPGRRPVEEDGGSGNRRSPSCRRRPVERFHGVEVVLWDAFATSTAEALEAGAKPLHMVVTETAAQTRRQTREGQEVGQLPTFDRENLQRSQPIKGG